MSPRRLSTPAPGQALHVEPALPALREMAGQRGQVPLCHTFIADCETPVSAFLKLRDGGPAFLLESAEQGQRVGRHSMIGVRPQAVSLFRRQAFGCPALPTCGLAMTEAENSLPGFASAVEAASLGDVDVVLRIAGCPNSCSRPPSAEIGIIGYGKNAHQITVGGSREGTRLGRELYPKVSTEQMNDILVGLLRAIKYHNPEGLPAGEFLHRTPNEKLIDLVGVEP